MKHKSALSCPGCKKHCSAKSPKCKFGRTYFAKAAKEKAIREKDSLLLTPKRRLLHGLSAPDKKRSFKWEKNIIPGGLAWKLFFISRSVKIALKKSSLTEEQIFGALTAEEREAFASMLKKLNDSLYS